MQIWHPDRFSGNDRRSSLANDKLVGIKAAYEVLTGAGPSPGSSSRERRGPDPDGRGAQSSSEPQRSANPESTRPEEGCPRRDRPDGPPRPVQRGDHWVYEDAAGHRVFARTFCAAFPFHEGRARVVLNENTYRACFIDLTGEPLSGSFHEHQDFSEGLAGVRIHGEWGFVDRDCTFVVAPQFSEVCPFSDGFAAVERTTPGWIWDDTKWGFIDKSGGIVIAPQFERVHNGGFHNGEALVELDRRWVVIDKSGAIKRTRA